MTKHFWTAGAAMVAGLVLLGGAACSTNGATSTAAPAETQDQTASLPKTEAAKDATPKAASPRASGDLSTADLVKLAEPSVVRIETPTGVGTGFIVSEDGYLVTNNHVVLGRLNRPATTVSVGLSDGSVVDGRVVGTDVRSDLALVKIEGGPYQALKLAKLEDTAVGEDVVAIGFALDLRGGEGPSYTVTRGIISAKNRAIDESSQVLGAIQTDAAINHGNSGGPLLNLRGEVVGVNTALAPDTTTGGTALGIGFAVGSDTVRAVYEQLKATGKVNRGLLGIQQFEALRPAKARDLGIPQEVSGVYLGDPESVAPGGPAAAAGIKTGDVITKIAGITLRNESDLALQMIKHEPGSKVEVELYRARQKITVQVTLGTPQ
jgi:S1-C subfamily serine protease